MPHRWNRSLFGKSSGVFKSPEEPPGVLRSPRGIGQSGSRAVGGRAVGEPGSRGIGEADTRAFWLETGHGWLETGRG